LKNNRVLFILKMSGFRGSPCISDKRTMNVTLHLEKLFCCH